MTATVSRDFIVKGAGKMLANKVSDTSRAGGGAYLGDMSVALKMPRTSVYGGDGLWPIGSIDGDRSGSIAFTNNKFNLDFIGMATGGTITRGTTTNIMELGEVHTVPGSTAYTVDLTYKTGAPATNVLAKLYVTYADGTPLTYNSTPAAGVYSYSSGTLTFATADASKVIKVDYLHSVTTSDKAGIVATALAFPVEIYHKGVFMDDVQGVLMGLQTYAPNIIANGDFNIDWKRGTASTHKLSFDIQDPQTGASVIELATYQV